MNAIQELTSQLGFQLDLTVVIATVGLMLARLLPLIMLSPFLGGEAIPPQVKMGLGVMLSIVLFPSVATSIDRIPVYAIAYIGLLMKEVFVGLVLAFVVALVFDAVRVAGNIIDTMGGISQAQVMVPMLQQQATVWASFKYMIAIVLFITLDGHHMVILAMAESFVAIPLDGFPTFSERGVWPFFELIVRIFGDLLRIGVSLAAPGMIAVFLTDLSMGMINRVAPQVQVFFISMSIKPLVVVLAMMTTIYFVLQRMRVEMENMLGILRDAIRILS